MVKKKAPQLPKEFKKYFWEYDFEKLSLAKGLPTILPRILSFGDMNAVKWIFNNVDHNKIKDYILRSGDRQLDKRSNNFWRIYFGLPKSAYVNKFWPF